MAVDVLDPALRMALVNFLMRVEDREHLAKGAVRPPNLGDIYERTMHDVKALCLGVVDAHEYLREEAMAPLSPPR